MDHIYGASFKDGRAVYVIKFRNMEEAQKWLRTEEYGECAWSRSGWIPYPKSPSAADPTGRKL